MTNPVWDWLVRSKLNAYQANQRFNGPSAINAGPCWCFDRFGQSKTQLVDGRVVFVSGEHEDHYDPDFFIYNDVVVCHPNGRVEIYGYPRDVFPPTDFHSATLVGNQIVIVGNLGHPEARRPGITQVLTLDLATFGIVRVQTCGESPGWIHGHTAALSEDNTFILLQGGKLDRGGEDGSLVENIDDWRLRLADWSWERLTQRRWWRWNVLRDDGKRNHLWEIQQAAWSRSVGWSKELREQMEQLETELGTRPNLDLVEDLFRPPIPHDQISQAEVEHNIFRIRVGGGVIIRYVVEMSSIQLTVEGDLDQPSVDVITSDLVRKLSTLENAHFVLKQI
jgi:mRNA-degrading endonuclease RelE of RelBE toxin-antitoxin system